MVIDVLLLTVEFHLTFVHRLVGEGEGLSSRFLTVHKGLKDCLGSKYFQTNQLPPPTVSALLYQFQNFVLLIVSGTSQQISFVIDVFLVIECKCLRSMATLTFSLLIYCLCQPFF